MSLSGANRGNHLLRRNCDGERVHSTWYLWISYWMVSILQVETYLAQLRQQVCRASNSRTTDKFSSLTPILVSYPLNCTTLPQFVLKMLPIFFISVSRWPLSVRLQPGTSPLGLMSISNTSLFFMGSTLYLPGMVSNLLKEVKKDLSPCKYNL